MNVVRRILKLQNRERVGRDVFGAFSDYIIDRFNLRPHGLERTQLALSQFTNMSFDFFELHWRTRPIFSQFDSLKIRRSTFPNCIKLVYLQILRLLNCERVGRVIII